MNSWSKPSTSSQVSGTNNDYCRVSDSLEKFITFFVKEFETKVEINDLISKGELKKAGKFSDKYLGLIGQAGGAAAGGLLFGLLGLPAAVVGVAASAGKKGTDVLSNHIGSKQRVEKAAKLQLLIELFQKEKAETRRKLVEVAYDIFQSFEMQFISVKSGKAHQKALQLLARDATNRAIDYYIQHKGGQIPRAKDIITSGRSKIEPFCSLPDPTSKIKTAGYGITYEMNTVHKEEWLTASLYEKAGIVITLPAASNSYYEKKGVSRVDKYGFRRCCKSEQWKLIKGTYEPVNDFIRCKRFLDYAYVLQDVYTRDAEEKMENILKKININDKSLDESRITQIIIEVGNDLKDLIMEDIDILKNLSQSYAEDHMVLKNIETNLKNSKFDDYLNLFKENFGELRKGQRKITESLEVSIIENRENHERLLKQQTTSQKVSHREHKEILEGMTKLNKQHEELMFKQVKSKVWSNMREPVKSFTGRVDELENLHTQLQIENRQVVISQIAAISGLGGIGKSELARKYAYSKFCDSNAVWINSETPESLKESFKRLYLELNIPSNIPATDDSQKADTKSYVKNVYKYFSDIKSLFIFDNAEEYASIVEFLPSSLHPNDLKPYILITSRNRDWDVGEDGKIEIMQLDQFKPEEANEFVSNFLNIEQNEHVEMLTKKLQYLPLALMQAVAYIQNENKNLKVIGGKIFQVSNYLEEYDKILNEANKKKNNCKNNDRYTETVLTTWSITLNKIEHNKDCGKQAIYFLNIMAYLSPDSINIKNIFSLTGGDERLKAFELLHQYCMINLKDGISNIHRLVQEVVRLNLKQKQKNEEVGVLREVLKVIDNNMSEDITEHVISLWNHASKYDELIDDFNPNLKQGYGYSKATPICLLASSGSDKVVETLLNRLHKKHPKKLCYIINASDKYNRTPLYYAAENGYIKLVDYFINAGIKIVTRCSAIYTRNSSNWTALHIAAFKGHIEIVRKLYVANKELSQMKDTAGRIPAIIAAHGGHEDIVNILKPKDKIYLFHAKLCATMRSDNLLDLESFIEELKKENKLHDVINVKLAGRSPLQLAAFAGEVSVVKTLVENGAKVKEEYNSFTPLHCAASYGCFDVVKYLVEETEADPKDTNSDGWTSLHAACQNGHLEIVKYFLNLEGKKAISIHICDKKGTTPLQTGAFHDNLNVVKFLLGNEVTEKADINVTDILGATPVFSALLHHNRRVAKFLLSNKADASTGNTETLIGKLKISMLHLAAIYDDDELIQYLINEKHIDTDIGKYESITPLHVAAILGSSKSIKCLTEREASWDIPVNVSNIEKILREEQNNTELKFSSMHGVVDRLITLVSYFASYLEFTASHLYQTFNSPDPGIFQRENNFSDKCKIIFLKVAISTYFMSRQIDNIKTYINKRKNRNLSLPIDVTFLPKKNETVEVDGNKSSIILHLAVQEGWTDLVRIVLNAGISIDAQNSSGQTALQLATLEGYLDIEQLLISKGAKTNIQDID